MMWPPQNNTIGIFFDGPQVFKFDVIKFLFYAIAHIVPISPVKNIVDVPRFISMKQNVSEF